MSFKLVLNQDAEVELGPTIECFKSFREIGALITTREQRNYDALCFVPETNEEMLPSRYVKKLRKQARLFLTKHSKDVSDHTRWIVECLADLPDKDESTPDRRDRFVERDPMFFLEEVDENADLDDDE